MKENCTNEREEKKMLIKFSVFYNYMFTKNKKINRDWEQNALCYSIWIFVIVWMLSIFSFLKEKNLFGVCICFKRERKIYACKSGSVTFSLVNRSNINIACVYITSLYIYI